MENVSAKPVVVWFALAVLCTFAAYLFATNGISHLWVYILGLGILQTAIQFLFFFSMSKEKHPRWNLAMFLFMAAAILIVVGGSVWIMNNLNYHMMPMES